MALEYKNRLGFNKGQNMTKIKQMWKQLICVHPIANRLIVRYDQGVVSRCNECGKDL